MNQALHKSMQDTLIETLQSKLRGGLQSAAPDRRATYAVLDFPNHANVGDSAIFVGESILLNEYFGRPPALVTEAYPADIDRVARLAGVDLLFLHGGGNFGDLWPKHQHFREAVLKAFPQKKIVQLPQSIFFQDVENLRRAADTVNRHPDFTLMVRDRASEAVARENFTCKIELVPDMAFMIGSLPRNRAPEQKTLCLIRSDHESRIAGEVLASKFPQPALVVDWPPEGRNRTVVARLKGKVDRASLRLARFPQLSHVVFDRLARKRVNNGVSTLSRGKIVVTDRLHAHILCILLDIPHVVLDNSYGKITTFIDAWTKTSRFRLARDLDTAAELAAELSEGVD